MRSTLQSYPLPHSTYSGTVYGVNADPIAYRMKDMDGWFINFHTYCCGTAIPPNDQIATEYAEFISSRFATPKSVDPTGKVSIVWGRLKSLR